MLTVCPRRETRGARRREGGGKTVLPRLCTDSLADLLSTAFSQESPPLDSLTLPGLLEILEAPGLLKASLRRVSRLSASSAILADDPHFSAFVSGDTSVIRDDSCGKTRDAGQVNISQEIEAIESSTGMPSVSGSLFSLVSSFAQFSS